jgi:hypothetical protein
MRTTSVEKTAERVESQGVQRSQNLAHNSLFFFNGVEITPGAALDVAGNFKGKQSLKTKLITVRHEVIISAGVFQTPRLVRFNNYFTVAVLTQRRSSWYFLCNRICPPLTLLLF